MPRDPQSSSRGSSLRASRLLWKRTHEHVRTAVIAEVTAGSAVTEAELTVLVQLREAGEALRQNVLVAWTGWDRTRLSHLLSRVAARCCVTRHKLRNGVDVVLEAPGQATFDESQPLLASIFHDRLLVA